MRLAKRLKSWARTLLKLVLLVLGYFWVGAAYKLIYAQTHDLSRFKNQLPISFYQQQFILESLLRQTWLFGPDFREYIGSPPPIAGLVSSNPQAILTDYLRQREGELSALPDRYPHSLFAEEALEDAYLLSQGASYLGLMSAREQPGQALAVRANAGRDNPDWRSTGLPNIFRSAHLARRLADAYPDSPQAPRALLRVAQMEEQQGRVEPAQAIYRRTTLEYPRADEAEEAANALYRAAQAAGQLTPAREYKRQALASAERLARERFPGKALPATPALSIVEHRVDLAGLELQLQRVAAAGELVAIATREVQRLKSLPSRDDNLKRGLRRTEASLERIRSQTWVAGLFRDLKVGVPGPPPRPREYDVSGRVLLGNRPLPGVELILADAPVGASFDPQALLGLVRSRYRAVSDAGGLYRIARTPAGQYSLAVIYALQPRQSGSFPVALSEGAGALAFPENVTVADKAVTLPPLRFERAVATRSFGELKPVGQAVRLEWSAWPGAAAYRVEVLAGPEMGYLFNQRVSRDKLYEFAARPVLWKVEGATRLSADCPLLALAPDNPTNLRFTHYIYTVTALDRNGKALAGSAAPLCRFLLSPEARAALMDLKPPVRSRRRFRGRQRQGQRPGRQGQQRRQP